MMAQEGVNAVAVAREIAKCEDDELDELVDQFNRHVASLPFLLILLRPSENPSE
jgi:hypothetical protein